MQRTRTSRTEGDKTQARRRQIQDAAFDCLIRHGYSKVGVNDIAEAAALSRPLVYLHFKSKEDIFIALFTELFEEQSGRVKEVLASGLRKKEKILEIFQIVYLDMWARLSNSAEDDDLFDATGRLFPKIGKEFRKQLASQLAQLVGDAETAELLILAVKGMSYDRPSTALLRRRIAALVDRFV